jgi:hypothetical protein
MRGGTAVLRGSRRRSMKQLPPPPVHLPKSSYGSCFIGSSDLQVISGRGLASPENLIDRLGLTGGHEPMSAAGPSRAMTPEEPMLDRVASPAKVLGGTPVAPYASHRLQSFLIPPRQILLKLGQPLC